MTRERERRRGLVPDGAVGRDVLRGAFEPCLLALLRASAGRDPGLTGWFPQALARTGCLPRAAELAYAIGDELRRGTELLELVRAAAGAGDLDGAQALAESIPLRQVRDRALVALVPAWARAGERDRAVALAERVRYPHHWGWAWALLAKAAADGGDADGALGFAARADDAVRACAADGAEQVLALLVEVAVAAGDPGRAAALADRVEDMRRSGNPAGWSGPSPLAVVLSREALAGDLSRLDALLRPLPGPAAGAGDTGCGWAPDETEAGVGTAAHPRVPGPPLDAWDMACVLDAVAETADAGVALALAERAETLLGSGGGRDHDILLRSVTLLLARHGQAERAMALTRRLDPDHRAARRAEVAGEVARSGETGAAEALAREITDRRARDRALIAVVREVARRGDPARAEALAGSINDRWAQGEALVAVARELARHGDPERAEAVTRAIAHRATRARALAGVAELSEPSRARRLAARAAALDGWDPVLPVLERIAPRSVAVIVDQMMS